MWIRIGFLCIAIAHCVNAFADNVIQWERGKELSIAIGAIDKKIRFEEPVNIGVPKKFKSLISVNNIDTTLYIKSKVSFREPIQIIGHGLKSRNVYVLSLFFSTNSAELSDVNVLTAPRNNNSDFSVTKSVSHIDLIRAVSQRLFSPGYAKEDIVEIKESLSSFKGNLNFLYRHGGFDITLYKQYRYKQYYVAVLKFSNQLAIVQQIDVRNMFGRIDAISATPQYELTSPKDEMSKRDDSYVYLLLDTPIQQAVKEVF